MSKGINTLIEETKQNMTDLINDSLRSGVPVTVIDLIMTDLIHDVKDTAKEVISQEKAKYDKEIKEEEKAKSEQVEYIPDEKAEIIYDESVCDESVVED